MKELNEPIFRNTITALPPQTPRKLLKSAVTTAGGRGGPDVGCSPVAVDVISTERPIFIKGKERSKIPLTRGSEKT